MLNTSFFIFIRQFLFILIFFFNAGLSLAQGFHGTILDSITHVPIAYAYVYSNNNETGTATNENGEFVLENSEDDLDVTVSHLSYASKKIQLHKNLNQTIYLTLNSIILPEVTLNDEAYLKSKSVFEKFIKERRITFGKAFYRQITSINEMPVEFLETFNDVAISAAGVEKHAIYESRYATKKSTFENPSFHFTNFSYLTYGFQLFSQKTGNIAKPFSSETLDTFNYSIIGNYTNNGCTYVIIKYAANETATPSLSGEFTINVTHYILSSLTATTTSSLGVDSLDIKEKGKKTKSVFAQNHLHQWTFKFNDSNPDVPLEFINVTGVFDFELEGTLRKVRTMSTMIVFETDQKRVKGLKEPNVKMNDFVEAGKVKYNSKFWKNNPIIQRTPTEEDIIKYFETTNSFGNFIR